MAARQSVAGPGKGRSAPILLVEDDADLRQLLLAALAEAGLPAVSASDGQQAITCLHQHRPALIVLDIVLPSASGMEVARVARARYGEQLPILVVTGAGQPQYLAQGVGAVIFMAKPLDMGQLVDLAQALLAVTSLEQAEDSPDRPLERPSTAE